MTTVMREEPRPPAMMSRPGEQPRRRGTCRRAVEHSGGGRSPSSLSSTGEGDRAEEQQRDGARIVRRPIRAVRDGHRRSPGPVTAVAAGERVEQREEPVRTGAHQLRYRRRRERKRRRAALCEERRTEFDSGVLHATAPAKRTPRFRRVGGDGRRSGRFGGEASRAARSRGEKAEHRTRCVPSRARSPRGRAGGRGWPMESRVTPRRPWRSACRARGLRRSCKRCRAERRVGRARRSGARGRNIVGERPEWEFLFAAGGQRLAGVAYGTHARMQAARGGAGAPRGVLRCTAWSEELPARGHDATECWAVVSAGAAGRDDAGLSDATCARWRSWRRARAPGVGRDRR